ncbi:MAG: cytochrome c [Bacteroidota bacterium]|nr:cytochrome c [Bacteroidota bacterium]MDP4232462.1 cytochrome c [Bacteroidota bacterium]MDP4241598.1 cytochrome c [Bacteroidota bacterium]MDP4286342.1 cytochrome c [Bacteroidota bacterium]
MKPNFSWTRLSAVLAVSATFAITAGLGNAFTPGGSGPKWMAPTAASGKKNPVASNAASISTGKKIFGKECESCHGKTGIGNGPKAAELSKVPGNLTTHEFQSQSDGAIFWKITKGNKPMPTFATAYSEEERWSVVNYLRTLGK